MTTTSSAMVEEIGELTGSELKYTNTERVAADISVRSGNATCSTEVKGKTGTTKITVSMELQRKVKGSWVTFRSWSSSKNARTFTLTKSETVSRGTYRVKSVVNVYKGSKSETITKYSSTATN